MITLSMATLSSLHTSDMANYNCSYEDGCSLGFRGLGFRADNLQASQNSVASPVLSRETARLVVGRKGRNW